MTLTEAAQGFKRLLRVGIIALIIILIIRVAWGITDNYLASKKPPPPPPAPTVLFGKLSIPKFVESTKSANFTFTIDTLNGKLPEASSTAKVYSYVKSTTSFGSSQKAKTLAKNLRFSSPPTLTSPIDYHFNDPALLARILTVNIVTGNFTLRYDVSTDTKVLAEKNLLNQLSAEGEFRNLLQSLGVWQNDLTGTTVFRLLKFIGNNFAATNSASEANAVFIGLNRQNVNNMPIVADRIDEPSVWAIMSGSPLPDKRFLEVHYAFREINQDDFATYPLKSVASAWQELVDGKATITQASKQSGGVAIKDIYLAYFDGASAKDYLEPIFVFGGEGFTAYLPAITSQWLE